MEQRLISSAILLSLAALSALSCSELKTGLPSPVAPGAQIHQAAWTDKTAAGFHGTPLNIEPSQFTLCERCHGADFAGGSSRVSCMGSGCHIDATGNPKSPLACNTCHGDFHGQANMINSAGPPRSIAGDTSESSPGVGAHQAHLFATDGKPVKCQECHTVPKTVMDPGHINTTSPRAIVAFNDTLSHLETGNGSYVPHPVYDPVAHICSNTYCHGSWQANKATADSTHQFIYTDSVIVGNRSAPVWTGGGGQAACGTCHDLPPKGHLNFNWTAKQCGQCHIGIVDADGNISDNTRHMNGMIDVFAEPERPF